MTGTLSRRPGQEMTSGSTEGEQFGGHGEQSSAPGRWPVPRPVRGEAGPGRGGVGAGPGRCGPQTRPGSVRGPDPAGSVRGRLSPGPAPGPGSPGARRIPSAASAGGGNGGPGDCPFIGRRPRGGGPGAGGGQPGWRRRDLGTTGVFWATSGFWVTGATSQVHKRTQKTECAEKAERNTMKGNQAWRRWRRDPAWTPAPGGCSCSVRSARWTPAHVIVKVGVRRRAAGPGRRRRRHGRSHGRRR